MQPGQTDAVDQFVAREANGYKAEGFSRQRVYVNRVLREKMNNLKSNSSSDSDLSTQAGRGADDTVTHPDSESDSDSETVLHPETHRTVRFLIVIFKRSLLILRFQVRRSA